MKKSSGNMGIWVTIIVVALGIFVYRSYFAASVDTTATDVASQGAGKEVVQLYSQLQTVNLDTSIFSSPTYRALIDFSAPVPTQPIGRPNPFDKS